MKKTPVNKLKYSEAVAELNNILEAMKNKNCDIDELTTMTRRASELIATLTLRLRSGWNVWVKTETSREHTPFAECVELYQASQTSVRNLRKL